METLITLGWIALGAALAAALLWRLRRDARPAAGDGLGLIQQQLEAIRTQVAETLRAQTQTVNQQLEAVSRQVMESQKTVGDRLDNAARVVGEVQRSLGTLGQASERIFEVGKDIAGLQEILRAPKMRGGLGEYLLGDFLAQVLPRHHQIQHVFKTGQIVDAVIRLGDKMVPVDSKFPLENFRRLLEAQSEEERRALKKKFAADVKKHVDAIASKYILPDEGTYDFALMYIPAENVYYECMIRDDASGDGPSLAEYARSKNIIPVSPNTLYAYLQAIVLGLRGFAIEENARLIMQHLSRLQGDFRRFAEDFDLLGKHLSNTRGKYEDAEKRLGRLQEKLASMGEGQAGEMEAPAGGPRLPAGRSAE